MISFTIAASSVANNLLGLCFLTYFCSKNTSYAKLSSSIHKRAFRWVCIPRNTSDKWNIHCTIRQDLQNAKIIKYFKALYNAKLRLYHEKVLYTFCTVANTNVSHDGQGWMKYLRVYDGFPTLWLAVFSVACYHDIRYCKVLFLSIYILSLVW